MKSKQLSFEQNPKFKDYTKRSEHGGGIRRGQRKLSRPFDSRQFMHVTMRSSRAKGRHSMLFRHHQRDVSSIIYRFAARFEVKVIRFANAGNHLHLLLKANNRDGLQAFLRTICGLIARLITGARKGSRFGKFWDDLAYSKLVSWGRQFKHVSNYVLRNTLEAFGVIPPRSQSRGHMKLDFESLFDDF